MKGKPGVRLTSNEIDAINVELLSGRTIYSIARSAGVDPKTVRRRRDLLVEQRLLSNRIIKPGPYYERQKATRVKEKSEFEEMRRIWLARKTAEDADMTRLVVWMKKRVRAWGEMKSLFEDAA